MSKFHMLVASVLLVGTAPAFAADSNYWSSPATACIPVAATIVGADYRDSGVSSDQYVTHAVGSLDPISFICPVSRNGTANLPNNLLMTYRDSTGATTTAFAKATLVRIDRISGLRTEIASVNSNISASTAVNRVRITYAHVLNFVTAYYHVRIDMDRSAATQNVFVFGVQLNNV